MRLVRNAIQTPDGTILESKHVHDYRTHIDAITREQYMVDGGLDYQRTNVNKVPAIDLCVYMEDGHDMVREFLTWGTRGKNGDEPLRFIRLMDMEDGHIQVCLDTQNLSKVYRESFENELKYRGVAYE